jgi:hypothetical protein
MTYFWNILRWILFIPSALLASQITTSLFRLISFGSTSELYYQIRPFIAEGFGGFGFILGGLFTAPKKDAWVAWTLLGLYTTLAITNVTRGHDFLYSLLESLSCVIGAILGVFYGKQLIQ